MFDQNDQNQPVQDSAAIAPTEPTAGTASAVSAPDPASMALPVADPVLTNEASTAPEETAPDTPAYNTTALPAPDEPASDTTTSNQSPVIEPTSGATPEAASDLLTIKQDALQNLTPLLSHLDQSPEEKFRTTMMMIQASDDQSLVRQAYDAAKEISDEKVRAQALLDIVNEINYFTQQQAKA